MLNLKTTYRDDNTTFFIQTHISPGFLPLFPPPVTTSLSRQLFRNSLTEGNITIHTGPRPRVAFDIVCPTPFTFTMDKRQKHLPPSQTAGSLTGFAIGTQCWTYGATLCGVGSNLSANVAYTFTELALQVKLGVELGLAGLALIFTGAWKNEGSGIAASVGLNSRGVLMTLEYVVPFPKSIGSSCLRIASVSHIWNSDYYYL